jgi:hypothetical protein
LISSASSSSARSRDFLTVSNGHHELRARTNFTERRHRRGTVGALGFYIIVFHSQRPGHPRIDEARGGEVADVNRAGLQRSLADVLMES